MNGPRGEIKLLINGSMRKLCLTLGALAQLETAFGCETLTDLQTRLRRLSANEMRDVLQILLCDGSDDASINDVSPGDAARAIGEAFHAALG